MNKRKFRTLNEVEEEYFTKNPKEIKQYLEVALEEYQKDGNEKLFLLHLRLSLKQKAGLQNLPKK